MGTSALHVVISEDTVREAYLLCVSVLNNVIDKSEVREVYFLVTRASRGSRMRR